MNPGYFRLRIPKDVALQRFAEWNQLPQVGPLIPTRSSEAVRLACDERGRWRGNAVFVSEVDDWTLFQDLSGGLSFIPGQTWLELAGEADLIFAGLNDAVGHGELVVIRDRVIWLEFLDYPDSPETNINRGELNGEHQRFKSWVDVACWMEGDELGFSEDGWLWIYERYDASNATAERPSK